MHNAQLVREKKTSETRTAVKTGADKRMHAPPRGNVARFNGGRAHSHPNPCLVPPSFPSPSPSQSPEGHAEIGHGTGWPGSRPDSVTTIPYCGATSTESGHSWPGRGGSRFAILLRTSMPSLCGLPGQ